MVLAGRPFDFDTFTSAKVKIIARECSLARGATVENKLIGNDADNKNKTHDDDCRSAALKIF